MLAASRYLASSEDRYELDGKASTEARDTVDARNLTEGALSLECTNSDLGLKLREAATGPAWKVNAQAGAAFVEKLMASNAELAAEAAMLLTREVRTAPTLVKYAQPNDYEIQTRAELTQAAAELLASQPRLGDR